MAAREARIEQQWECEDIGSCVAFFFCARGRVRAMVTIEMRPPPAIGGGMVTPARIRFGATESM